MKDMFYINYEGKIELDGDMILIAAWNEYNEYIGGGEKIFINDKEFFENSFKNPYDAAWAVSSGNWEGADKFVYFNSDGRLISFNHWDDEKSPIDIDKIDISNLINDLKDLKRCQGTKTKCVNNISRAIQDALEEV